MVDIFDDIHIKEKYGLISVHNLINFVYPKILMIFKLKGLFSIDTKYLIRIWKFTELNYHIWFERLYVRSN